MYFIVDQKAAAVRFDDGRRQRLDNRSYKPTVDNAESDGKPISTIHESQAVNVSYLLDGSRFPGYASDGFSKEERRSLAFNRQL